MDKPFILKIENHTFYVYGVLQLIYRMDDDNELGLWDTVASFSFREIENGRLDFTPGPILYDRDYIELTTYLKFYKAALAKYKKLSIFI